MSRNILHLSVANDMSGIVAHNLSGLLWSSLEVPDETDGDATEVQLSRSATEKIGTPPELPRNSPTELHPELATNPEAAKRGSAACKIVGFLYNL